jgi:hypothetical protein
MGSDYGAWGLHDVARHCHQQSKAHQTKMREIRVSRIVQRLTTQSILWSRLPSCLLRNRRPHIWIRAAQPLDPRGRRRKKPTPLFRGELLRASIHYTYTRRCIDPLVGALRSRYLSWSMGPFSAPASRSSCAHTCVNYDWHQGAALACSQPPPPPPDHRQ